jgi:hypothetical protein
VDPQQGLTVLDIARRIVTDPQVIRDLAGEVSEAIFSTSLREQLRLALVSTLAQRLDAHGKATSALSEVREELTQRWRILQGGENGQPTPTKELVAIHQALTHEVGKTEDLLSKTVKMAIDEFRSQKGNVSPGGGLDPLRFQGTGEALPIPASIGPQDREAMRQLYSLFDSAITQRRTLDAEVSGSRAAADLPAGDGQQPRELDPAVQDSAMDAEPTIIDAGVANDEHSDLSEDEPF